MPKNAHICFARCISCGRHGGASLKYEEAMKRQRSGARRVHSDCELATCYKKGQSGAKPSAAAVKECTRTAVEFLSKNFCLTSTLVSCSWNNYRLDCLAQIKAHLYMPLHILIDPCSTAVGKPRCNGSIGLHLFAPGSARLSKCDNGKSQI